MTAFTPIRNDNAYFAIGVQTAQGTPVAPSVFVRWLDGSSAEPDLKTEEIWEGDGSRNVSQVIKNGQKWKVKIAFYPRPEQLAMFEALSMGIASDSFNLPVNTTLTGATTAGVTGNVGIAVTTNLPGSGTKALMVDKGLSTEEVVLFAMPASGSTITVSSLYNGGKFATSHLSGATIQGPSSHTITEQADGVYVTTEVCLGALNGGAGETFRIRDCKVDTIKRTGDKGKPLQFEIELVGIACAVLNSPSTIVLENRQIFLFSQGTWTLDGDNTLTDNAAIEKFSFDQKNNLDVDIQANSLLLSAIIFGNYDLKVQLDIIMTSMRTVNKSYFGSASGTADSQVIGTGSAVVTFLQPDGFHSVQYTIASTAYINSKPPQPKKDGKHYMHSVEATATSGQGTVASLITAVISNAVNAAVI